MRSNSYYQRSRIRRPTDDLCLADQPPVQQFGDVTSMVNALRNRAIYRFASLRLLSDLVEASRTFEPAAQREERRARGIAPPPPEPLLTADYPLIERAAESSPVLFRSLGLPENPHFTPRRREPTLHRVLLGQESALGAPVEALAHLLAAEIARQFDEPAVAVVGDDGTPRATLWTGQDAPQPFRWRGNYARFRTALVRKLGDGVALVHVIVAAPAGPASMPKGFADPVGYRASTNRWSDGSTVGYDRLVYLSQRAPEPPPDAWLERLNRTVFNPDNKGKPRGPVYFSSFIHSVVGEDGDSTFDTLSVDDEFQIPSDERALPESWRVERDHCRIPFDFKPIRAAWELGVNRRSRNPETAMLASAKAVCELLAKKDIRALAGRWARAVTNRRVGVALGGGGASAFRLVPIVDGIRDNDVPIDLVGGVSGGALVGAYYSKWGRKGMKQCLRLGERIGLRSLAGAFCDASFFKRLVDDDLGETQVTGTQARLVALTTVLVPDGPPQSHIVTRGTLGDAVQVSGAAAVMFAPVVRETASHGEVRFGDGSMSSYVPARILRDCGADVIFAFNCLSGPESHNPFGGTWLAGLPKVPIVSRLIDLWVSGAYLVQRIGRETDEDAHVYFEPGDHEMPLVESFYFTHSHRIARRSARSPRVRECIADCAAFWRRARTTRPPA